MTNITERVIEELQSLGASYREISNFVGVSHTTIKNYGTGRSTPGADTLAKLHYAGVDILYILTGHRLLSDITHDCVTCAHYCDGDSPVCEKYDFECHRCPRSKVCRECKSCDLWLWRGFINKSEG